MKGSIEDFATLARRTPALERELSELAKRYGFEFSDELSEDELGGIAGGFLRPTLKPITRITDPFGDGFQN